MTAIASPSPIALGPDAGEAIWFLDFLTTIKASSQQTGGAFTLIEQAAPHGSGSPLHLHTREDEWFYVLEGSLTVRVGAQKIELGPGAFAYAPRNIAHTFMVSHPNGARWLLGTTPAGFEDFVRSAGRPAQALALPPASLEQPTPERLTAIAADYGIEILGPPGV